MMDYLDFQQLKLISNDNQLLTCIYKGKTYEHCKIVRCFPFQKQNEFLSVNYLHDNQYVELGMIKDLDDLDESSRKSVINDLNFHYHFPEIKHIYSRKYSLRCYSFRCNVDEKEIIINVDDLVNNIFVFNQDMYIKDVNKSYYLIKNYQDSKDKQIKYLKGLL